MIEKDNDQLEQLLNELRQKREDPSAIKLHEVEKNIDREPLEMGGFFSRDFDAPAGEKTKAEEESDLLFRIKKARDVDYHESATASRTSEFSFVKIESKAKDQERAGNHPKRDFFSALDVGSVEDPVDPINKSMLPPSIQRGIDLGGEEVFYDQALPPAADGNDAQLDKARNHPLFTQQITREIYIPEEGKAEKQTRNGFDTQELAMEDFAKRAENKNILNVKDNLDDNFREFFGDTVIIDKQPLSEKAKKTRKIKDYVMSDDGSGGRPVFEDDEDAEPDEVLREYKSEEETEEILSQLMSRKAGALVKTILSGLIAVILTAISFVEWFSSVPSFLSEPVIFYAVCAILLGLSIAVNLKQVLPGLGRLLSFRADPDAVISFALVAAVLESVVMIFVSDTVLVGYGAVAACATFLSAAGRFITDKRVLSDFITISQTFDKYASSVQTSSPFIKKLTARLNLSHPRLLMKRKTGFTEGFIAHAYSKEYYSRRVSLVSSISVFLSFVVGITVYLLTQEVVSGIQSFCCIAVLGVPFASTLAYTLPLNLMHKKLSKVGAVIPGYSAAKEISGANCVVVDGRELFPKGNVMLHGIKTFERERIDKAILQAASVIVQACDTMSPMFLNVIQNKMEMLHDVDSVEYESGLGFSYWIDQSRILLGTRDLMKEHDVDVPSRDYEARYTKSHTREAIYLAVSGKLNAMFVVSYSANPEVMNALNGFSQEGLFLIIHTRDFNITAEKVAALYKLPKNMISIVDSEDSVELTKMIEYTDKAPSALTHIGTLTSFVRGVSASVNLKSAVKRSMTIEMIGVILGLLIGVVFSLLGILLGFGMPVILYYQLIWCAISVIFIVFHRY